MRFKKILEQALENTNLTRVRLKCDPSSDAHSNFRELDGYEGYVLEEEGEMVTVIIPDIVDEPQQVPQSMTHACELSEIDQLKIAAIKYLNVKKGADKYSCICRQIANSDSPHFIESYLIEYGCSSEDLLNIYRIYFQNHE